MAVLQRSIQGLYLPCIALALACFAGCTMLVDPDGTAANLKCGPKWGCPDRMVCSFEGRCVPVSADAMGRDQEEPKDAGEAETEDQEPIEE